MNEFTKVFRALSDEKRVMILEMLCEGEQCACGLLEKLDISQPTLSHHMKILCESQLVRGEKVGVWMYYSIDAEGCEHAVKLLNSVGNKSMKQWLDAFKLINKLTHPFRATPKVLSSVVTSAVSPERSSAFSTALYSVVSAKTPSLATSVATATIPSTASFAKSSDVLSDKYFAKTSAVLSENSFDKTSVALSENSFAKPSAVLYESSFAKPSAVLSEKSLTELSAVIATAEYHISDSECLPNTHPSPSTNRSSGTLRSSNAHPATAERNTPCCCGNG